MSFKVGDKVGLEKDVWFEFSCLTGEIISDKGNEHFEILWSHGEISIFHSKWFIKI